jgi:hypothetical protein
MAPKGDQPPEIEMLTIDQQRQAIAIIGRDLASTMGGMVALQELGDLAVHDSAHGVFFAEAPDGRALALKRFKRDEKAQREVDNMAIAQARGMETFTLAGQGLYGIDDVGTVMVTHRIPSFMTMNQLPWAGANPGIRGYSRFERNLGAMTQHLAKLHGANGAHNDAQVKNFGRNRLTGVFVAHDLEGARFEEEGQASSELLGWQRDDMRKMLRSLATHRFLVNANAGLFAEEIDRQVLESYIEVHESEFMLDAWSDILADAQEFREGLSGPGTATFKSMNSDSPGS